MQFLQSGCILERGANSGDFETSKQYKQSDLLDLNAGLAKHMSFLVPTNQLQFSHVKHSTSVTVTCKVSTVDT